MEVLIIKEDPARTLASVPPGLVQKILHFLPLDKVHEAKQVSKLYRSAAHSAMTHGRWKPVRLFAEHFKRHGMPPLALCRAAWDLDPSETLRLALTRHGPEFLALVEPSLDGLERILRACEPAHDYFFREPLPPLDKRARVPGVIFRIITVWAKLIGSPITGWRPWVLPAERRALVLRCLSRALRTWTDAAVAVNFFREWMGSLAIVVPASQLTRDWEEGKASAFAAAYVAARRALSRIGRCSPIEPPVHRPVRDRACTCCIECSRSRNECKECKSRGPGRKCWTCKKLNRKCSFVYNPKRYGALHAQMR